MPQVRGTVIEPADLRDDPVLRSLIVVIDAVLLSFDAPKQFPDSSVLVQLDADLAFEAVEVEPDEDEEGVESIKFSTVEELVRCLSMCVRRRSQGPCPPLVPERVQG